MSYRRFWLRRPSASQISCVERTRPLNHAPMISRGMANRPSIARIATIATPTAGLIRNATPTPTRIQTNQFTSLVQVATAWHPGGWVSARDANFLFERPQVAIYRPHVHADALGNLMRGQAVGMLVQQIGDADQSRG